MKEHCVVKGHTIDCNPDGTLKDEIDVHALLLHCYEGYCYGPLMEGVSSDLGLVLQKQN